MSNAPPHIFRKRSSAKKPDKEPEEHCFLCFRRGIEQCQHCQQVSYCCEEHKLLHRRGNYCFPYKVGWLKGKGRVLFATRDIRALDLILIDPGTVVGPNYRSKKVCLECLKLLEREGSKCPACRFPLCGPKCAAGARHAEECSLLQRSLNRANAIAEGEIILGYSHISVLRLLLLAEKGGDKWARTDELMDHLGEKGVHPQEWVWYNQHIVDYIKQDMDLGQRFTSTQIERAIGLLNVNAVCLQFPKLVGHPNTEVGKGVYPIFAIMSHECVCNARYVVDPATFNMYVRARTNIKVGEELTVQYLSALSGNHRRRKRIKEEWYFDCCCRRCSDKTECGSYISAVKCMECSLGNLLPADPLDFNSTWTCSRCPFTLTSAKIEILTQDIQNEFDAILDSGEFHKFKQILDNYSGRILHPNHWIMTTARRNLIQYLCYSSSQDIQATISLEEKYKLCQDFWMVLNKVDPGWSELSMFAQRELHFAKLALLQQDYAMGIIGLDEFSVKSRNSIDTLEKVNKHRKMLVFDSERDQIS